MKREKKLLVGMDLKNDITLLSCCSVDKPEIISIGRKIDGERKYEFPTVLFYDKKQREWSFGLEALQKAEVSEEEKDMLFSDIINQIREKDCVECNGHTVSSVEILERFFVKILSCTREYFPNDMILKIVVSMPEWNDQLKNAVKKAMSQIEIGEDRLILQLHRQSYMYYALSQKMELWMNDVGLFEFGKEGLFYSQIHIDRRTTPYVTGVHEKKLSSILNWDMMENDSSFNVEQAFLNIANSQLYNQTVTTIYVTGEGFEGMWAENALQYLCEGRRVFRGSNLFTKGACYAAKEFAGKGTLNQFLLLDDERTYSSISVLMYADAKLQEIPLVKAGAVWKDVDVSLDFIPDKEEEIQLTTNNILRHEKKVHFLSLAGFENRENKMTRFTVRIRFADASHCIVTLKDNGFGAFYASSNRIWERKMDLGSYGKSVKKNVTDQMENQ